MTASVSYDAEEISLCFDAESSHVFVNGRLKIRIVWFDAVELSRVLSAMTLFFSMLFRLLSVIGVTVSSKNASTSVTRNSVVVSVFWIRSLTLGMYVFVSIF